MNVLTLEQVTVRKDGHRLLDAVSLAVPSSGTMGVVGVSGAGKSTLVRVALGLERPLSGTVRWGTVDPYAEPREAVRAARRHVGAVAQHPAGSFDPRLTLAQSVAEPLVTHLGGHHEAYRAEVSAALQEVGLPAHYAHRRPRALSGGEAQRAAIARALILKPALCVLDEPTSALDPLSADTLVQLIRRLGATRQTAFLLVSHDLGAVAAVASKLTVLDRGQVVEQGVTDASFAAPRSEALQRLLSAWRGERV